MSRWMHPQPGKQGFHQMHSHLPETAVGAESNVELDANLEIKNFHKGNKMKVNSREVVLNSVSERSVKLMTDQDADNISINLCGYKGGQDDTGE